MENDIKTFHNELSTLLCRMRELEISTNNTSQCGLTYRNISIEFLSDGADDVGRDVRFYRDYVLFIYLLVALENILETFTTLDEIEVRDRITINPVIWVILAVLGFITVAVVCFLCKKYRKCNTKNIQFDEESNHFESVEYKQGQYIESVTFFDIEDDYNVNHFGNSESSPPTPNGEERQRAMSFVGVMRQHSCEAA